MAVQLLETELPYMTFAGVGDLTEDGIDDFAVGLTSVVGDVPGMVLFIPGRRVWPETILLREEAFARLLGKGIAFGYELAIPGDVDGDGALELLAGCCEENPEPSRAYLIPLGSMLRGEIQVEPFVSSEGGVIIDRPDREFEAPRFLHVAAAGDVNGDGHSDVLVSDEGGAETLDGITFLVPGGPGLVGSISLPTATPEPWDGIVRVFGSSQRVQSGRALGPAGDWNGDDFDDFLVGEQNLDPFLPGNMFIVLGDAALPAELRLRRPGRHAHRLAGTQDITRLDRSTPRPADLNGDGRADFAFSEMGSPRFPTRDGVPSPGVVHVVYGIPETVPFIRADANSDLRVDLSDAIFTLAYLFLGDASPFCMDAADADDSGGLDITDAIGTLNHLFLGSTTIPAPYPEPGSDPTTDGLGCRGF
jgi:hypothetical protein